MNIKCVKNYEFPEGEIEYKKGMWYQINMTDSRIVGDMRYFPILNSEGDLTLFNGDCEFFDFRAIKW